LEVWAPASFESEALACDGFDVSKLHWNLYKIFIFQRFPPPT
jgi:hypothetical protein